ncbi:deoxyribodipyrimidine photolyase-like protein [Lentisphaera araneosa HTCC2155]|uniref:Deoxyribodipyrimidine photolyase-like protein n=1 Tax=Lentisphaera araneosa HTCC2155 TaxID=313628 RepID=A6DFN0_9BACT|nr:FAD-binding domain-containing protein [Lentisphaera araneosa]EDM29610.1 deoxyribodipyrimidine photolyase-like protein [Lentisphaera araneosa HTCC2155]
MKSFATSYENILDLVDNYKPDLYGRTRNYLNGAVSYLSAYISRGIISTRTVYDSLIKRGYDLEKIEKFVQELAWRDYWQSQWNYHGAKINHDLRHSQMAYNKHGMPSRLVDEKCSIQVFNTAIKQLKTTGYLHNHMRMYLAMSTCNIGGYHWHDPARWMYYHLIDGDWASNALSWQWVAGCLNGKKYIANQENINKYCGSLEEQTFLDKSYDELSQIYCLDEFDNSIKLDLKWQAPNQLNPEKLIYDDCLIFNYYNLDPQWRKEQVANRILLLEAEVFEKYPVSPRVMNFFLQLSRNIPDLILFTGSFADLRALCKGKLYYRQHPLNQYEGIEDRPLRSVIYKVTLHHFLSTGSNVKKL